MYDFDSSVVGSNGCVGSWRKILVASLLEMRVSRLSLIESVT